MQIIYTYMHKYIHGYTSFIKHLVRLTVVSDNRNDIHVSLIIMHVVSLFRLIRRPSKWCRLIMCRILLFFNVPNSFDELEQVSTSGVNKPLTIIRGVGQRLPEDPISRCSCWIGYNGLETLFSALCIFRQRQKTFNICALSVNRRSESTAAVPTVLPSALTQLELQMF